MLPQNLASKYDIIFVTSLYLNDIKEVYTGGAEIHLHHIIQTLKSKKSIIVFQKSLEQDELVDMDNYQVFLIKATTNGEYKKRLKKIFKTIYTDRIHVNYLDLHSLLPRVNNVIYSATFHGTGWDFPTKLFPKAFVPDTWIYHMGSIGKKSWYIWDQIRGIKKMDHILSVDTSLLRFAQFFMTNLRTSIDVVPNFVNIKKFHPKPNGTTNKQLTILFPRNISFARGVHFLVPLVQDLVEHNIDFVIQVVGGGIKQIGGSKYEQTLKKQIKAYHLSKYFEFLGQVPHDNMPEIMNNCDIVMIPTMFSEGTSLAGLEAMAMKKPLIATNIGGLNDIITHSYNGFLCQPTVSDLSRTIRHVVDLMKNDPKKLDKIIDHAYDMVTESYDDETWEKRVHYFFQKTK